jgi:hypothetical protein
MKAVADDGWSDAVRLGRPTVAGLESAVGLAELHFRPFNRRHPTAIWTEDFRDWHHSSTAGEQLQSNIISISSDQEAALRC